MGQFQSAKTHCKRGHEFSPENTRVTVRDSRPRRYCRACRRADALAYYHRPGGREVHTLSQRQLNQSPEGRLKKQVRAKKHYCTEKQKTTRAARDRARRASPIWRARKAALTRASYIRREYGITIEEYNRIIEAQEGVCAICKRPPENRKFSVGHIDHDHANGKVRGVLCSKCNQAIGLFGESIDRLQKAIGYLRRHSADPADH